MPKRRADDDRGDRLKAYRGKRDFRRTPEPGGEGGKGGGGRGKASGGRPRFVIQKHDASTLHYDFRLQVDGVLRSWAVPKGPSTDPSTKRLAVPTEDHPLAYARFEGVIPRGSYGAGTVIVWDTGTYRNLDDEHSIAEGLERGHIAVRLDGRKLEGGWALTRIARGKDERWLLVKMDDDQAAPERDLLRDRPESVLSGRTTEEVERDARDSRKDESEGG